MWWLSELRIKVVVEKPAAEESTAVDFDQRFLAPALPAPVKGIEIVDSVSSAKPFANFAEILVGFLLDLFEETEPAGRLGSR